MISAQQYLLNTLKTQGAYVENTSKITKMFYSTILSCCGRRRVENVASVVICFSTSVKTIAII